MKRKYKFVEFAESFVEPDLWLCFKRKEVDLLGHLELRKNWRQWVFAGQEGRVFSADCLRDIIFFMGQLPKP